MSLPRFKRPTSARRNVKYDSFTQNVSATRLRHLQSLLAENENGNEPDAILCISGIDSRYNDGMYELLNYLLFGFFDVRKSEFERTGIDEEVIEDLLITVKRDSVEVYCNPVNYLYLLPYISHWQNIHFHCLTDAEYEDEEAAEEYKITSLIAMVKGCKKIGIPFSSTRTIHDFDIFAVEKWPIIQAFAYEGYEGGGFFTLKHEVVDISIKVHNIYTFMDPVTIEILTKEHLPLIEQQWHTMMSTVDVELSSRPDSLTEGKVCESLKSFYQHGLVGNPKLTDGLVPFPVVVFGTRANKQIMGQAARGEEMEGRIASSGVSGKPALTVVCQAVAPKFPLTCARTYFICPVYNPFTENLPERKTLTDFDVLTVLYQAVVEAVLEAIEIYVTTQQFDQAQAAALEGVADRCRAVASPSLQSYLSERSRLTFRIEGLDNVGGCGKKPGLQQRLCLKLATCTLWDVPSHQHPGHTLGALIFAETFQDSVILVQNSDKSIDFSTDCLVLTSHIPRYKQWNATPEDAATRKQIQEELPHRAVPGMGTLLSGGDSIAVLTTSHVTYPAENANLFAFEHGLVIQSPQYGAFPLLGSSLDQVAFFDGDSSNTVALMILHIKAEALVWLPPHLQTADRRLILAFLPGSTAHKALYKKILIGWKEESQMPEVIRAEVLPQDLVPIHEDIQMRFVEEGRSSVLPSQLINFHTSLLPHIKRFMKHFEVSSVGGEVPRQEINIALQKVSELPVKKDGQIVVNIITGVPGSYQENLVGKLKTLGKEHVRWVMLGDLGLEPKPWGFPELQELLSQTLREHRQQLAKPDAKATRVILLNPGLMDTQDLVRAVTNHRNMAIGDIFRIGAVTVCIDPKNFFIEHKMPFPGLLNLCAEGWVNTILFTEPPHEENLELDDLQNLIRGINSNVSLILADRALITRSPDLELVLSETAFSHPDMIRARLLLTPNWHKAPPPGSKTRSFVNVVLRFKSPLDKPRFVSQLKGLKSSHKGVPYQGNIYRVQGRVRFTGSQQHQKLDFVSLTDHLSTTPVPGDSSNPFFLQFWGYGLEQDHLKDWLRISAPKKPQRRPLLTRQDVTRDQIQKIHKGRHLDPLPEGWFYNGTTFVSMGGEKSDTHPNLEQFIEDYIERRNVEIAKHNASIPAETEDDFFL